jgi:hypothetical protein
MTAEQIAGHFFGGQGIRTKKNWPSLFLPVLGRLMKERDLLSSIDAELEALVARRTRS